MHVCTYAPANYMSAWKHVAIDYLKSGYFCLAEHEERQNRLKALRNRQDLFQEEGILNLILDAIDNINTISSQGFLVALAGEDSGQNFDVITAYLYQLLGELWDQTKWITTQMHFILFFALSTCEFSLANTTCVFNNFSNLFSSKTT